MPNQIEPGVFAVDESDRETEQLIAKGFVPRRTAGPLGSQTSWERPANGFDWPQAAVLIALQIFILLAVWGSPW